MLKINLQNMTTGKTVVCDVLSHGRFHMRVVPEGTAAVVINLIRRRERHAFHADAKTSGGLILETIGETYGHED